MALDFDYNAARKAGYSDDQILDGLRASGDLDFDVDAARKKYSATDIIQGILPQPKAPEPAPEPSGIMGRVKDIGISALKGAISVPESAIGLADIVTGGAAGRGAEAIGFRPAEAKAILNDYYSPEQKAANREVEETKGFVPTIGAMLANPSTLVQGGVESLPLMGAGGVVGRGVLAAAPRISALAGAAIGEGAVGAGSAAEQTRQQTADGSLSLGQAGAALASGIGTGAFALVGGRLAKKLGIEDIDTALVQAGAPAGSTRGVVRRMLEGGVSEGVFEELPQSIQEQMWQNAAMDKPLMEGVPENAAKGLLLGGLFGGVAGMRSKAPAAVVNPDQPEAAPLLLGNTPDPFLSFPDGSVGRKSDAEAFINGLPEADRLEARARLFGMQEQTVTPEDVLGAESVDAAIDIANRAVEQGTPEFRAQRDAEIDAAWSQHVTDLIDQMNSNYDAAEQQRLEAELQGMMDQRVNQNVEQAEALTEAQGFDNPGPTAMQLAMQEAQSRRVAATDAARQDATIATPQQGVSDGTEQIGNAGLRQDSGLGGAESLAPTVSSQDAVQKEPGARADIEQGNEGNQQDAPPAQQQRPQAQADAEVAQAKAVLTAAGVTGNERMAALRSIRTGENTIEDLIDAHPPKAQEAANADRNAVDVGGNGDVGGRGAGIAAGDGPVDGRGDVPVGGDGRGRQSVAGLDDTVAEQRGAAVDDNASPAADTQPALAPTNSLSRDSSWVIRNKATGEVMLETFDKKKVDALNTEKYEAVPVQQHLGEINTPGTLANQVATGEQASAAEDTAEPQTPMQSEVDRLRAGRDARIEAQRNKPKSESQLATEAKYARQEAEIARAKENAEARKQAKEPAPAAEPSKPDGTVTERYLGRYGKGMSENNAKTEAADRNKKGDGTNWRVEANEELGYDRYEVVGYKDTKPRKSESPNAGGMTAAAVNKAIVTLKAKWLGFTRVNVVQSVEDIPAEVQERAQADAGTEGIYDPQTKAVYLIADNIASPERAAWVAAHEVQGHAGLRMLHDKSVNEALNIAGANRFVKNLATAIQQDRGDVSSSVATEEALAELSAATESDDFAALEDRYRVKVPTASRNGVIGAVARVYEAVKRFLASVMGKPVSAVSDADVRALIGEQQAAVEGRDAPDRQSSEQGVFASVKEAVTNTPAFKRWFGKSKVVDESGNPLVMYHGSKKDFTAFDKRFLNGENGRSEGAGFYFTSDRDIASSYSTGGKLFEAYLAIEKPLPYDAKPFTVAQMQKVILRAAELESENEGGDIRDGFLANWGDTYSSPPTRVANEAARAMVGEERAIDQLGGLMGAGLAPDIVNQALRETLGYDGFSAKGFSNEGGADKMIFIAMEPSQIKSATDNNGNFDPNEDSILKSRAPTPAQEVIPKWAENESDAVKAALRKAGIIYTEETFKQKVAKLKEGALKKLQYGILDQFAPIKDQLGRIPYVMARMAKNADGTLEALMLYGRPHLDADGGMLVDTTKKGFIETMQILNGEHDRFFSWMAGRRAEQLKKEGRENLFTDADISNLSTLNQGRMKDGSSREATYLRAQKDVAELNKSVLDIAEASGLIDPESRKIWASEIYVPFYRLMEEGVTGPSIKSGLVNQKSIKKLKGGTNNLGDLTQNMLMNWSTLLTASAKNRAAKASLEAAKQIGAATEADEATIRAMGKSASTKAVSYMDNGVNRWHVVEDDALLAAISALEFNGYNNNAMRAMSWFKTTLTKLVTISPYFKVRNLIRDSLSVLAVSDINRNPLVNIKNGYSLMRNNDARAQMVAGGGIYRFGMTMEGNRAEHIKKLIDSGVPDDTILNTAEKMQKFFGKLWSAYEEVGDLSENVNRAALYQKLRNEGVSHLEASFEARDLMDFGLSGAWAGVRALNQILPFMNARLQGLRKLGVGYNDDPKRMMYVVGALTLATIALSLAFKDDDDFKKRSDSDRNNYWWFKVGGIAYRIPRPFEIGAAATAIDNFSALFYDSKNTNIDRFTTQMSELINGQLAMNPIPQVFRPLIDVYANKDAFSGRPIESMAMQRLRPEDRYTNNTSELARLLSKSGVFVDPVSLVAGTGVRQLSPVQIDSLIKGYFAGAGVFAVAGADGLLHHTLIDRGAALPVPLKTLTGSFAEDLPSNSSRYVDMLYKTAQDVEQTYASYQNAVKQGDIEKARGIMKDEGATIAKYHMIESLKKNESRIGQVIQRTMNDKTLTGEQKAETIRRLKAVQDKIARQLVAR